MEILQEYARKISAETTFAKPGTDEGLIPIYSLLGEIIELEDLDSEVEESVRTVWQEMENQLDRAEPWNDDLIRHCQNLSAFLSGDQPKLSFSFEQKEREETPSIPESSSKSLDYPLQIKPDEDVDLLNEFVNEASEHLDAIEENILVLEKDPVQVNALSAVFRAFHTIKGVSGFLQLDPIQGLAHEVETLLDHARNGDVRLNEACITIILKSRDTLFQLVQVVRNAVVEPEAETPTIHVDALISDVKRITTVCLQGEPEIELKLESLSSMDSSTEKEDRPTQLAKSSNPTIRVEAEKVANLMDMVGELVIVESQLTESTQSLESDDLKIQRNIAQLNRITKDLQHMSMTLRMVPVKPTFQKVGRMVRDLSRLSNKEVNLEISGEDTELDRSMVEKIGDPLVHMVRNAIDHGLEASSEDRVSAGKDPVGQVKLKAYHMGSNIVIELSDDGRGILPDKILRKAIEKGLVDENTEMTDEEIYQLIFRPGFSTATEITDISGRGVGMDVVKKNIDELRGMVIVDSSPGRGTIFKIKLPLTTAIIEGLVVRVGTEKFVLPTHSVQVILRPTIQQMSTIANSSEILILRDRTVPLVRLHQQFNIDQAITNPTEGTVVIIESFGKCFALLVDEMVHKQEVVIKNLGYIMRKVEGVAGGAILGDGSIALILDAGSLAGKAFNQQN